MTKFESVQLGFNELLTHMRQKFIEESLAGTMQLKWGAHAPPRAVLRALAEHIGLLLWPNRLVNRKNWNQRARAPAGTREGACAPRNELNRSGLELRISPQKLLKQLNYVPCVRPRRCPESFRGEKRGVIESAPNFLNVPSH